jgi:type I restriction enzyme S subunit
VEWIGDIPDYWVVGRWRYYFSSGMGQTILKEDLIENGEIPVFSATEGNNYFGYVNKSNLILENGDIVIPARGNSIGYVKIVNEKSTTTQTTIYSKRRSNKINSNFIYYYCIGKKKLLFPFVQTAIPQITVEEINSNYIILPPLQEQEQIVKYLDEKTTIIDKLISTKERKIELLKEQRTSLINEVITKGLKPNVKMKDSGVEWIGEIPESWIVGKLNFYCDRIGDGLHSTPIYDDDGEYHFINGNNIKNGKVIITENTRKVNEVEFNNHFTNFKLILSFLKSFDDTIVNQTENTVLAGYNIHKAIENCKRLY